MSNVIRTEDNNSKHNHNSGTGFGCKGPGLLRRWFHRRAHKHNRCIQPGIKRLVSKLSLADAQRDGLEDVFKEFGSLMQLSHSGRTSSFKQLVISMNEESFDIDKARSGIDGTIQGIQNQLNNTITTFGAWFNTLNTDQRDRLRHLLAQRFKVSPHSV